MSEKKKDQEKSKIDFLSDFTIENLEASADLDIKPKLTLERGIEHAIDVIIMSIPYPIELPKDKVIGKDSKIWMIDLEFNDIVHQFTCQASSFRYQLGVLMKKLEIVIPEKLIDLPIRIWKTLEQINTPTFKGKAEMYHISMI